MSKMITKRALRPFTYCNYMLLPPTSIQELFLLPWKEQMTTIALSPGFPGFYPDRSHRGFTEMPDKIVECDIYGIALQGSIARMDSTSYFAGIVGMAFDHA